jgi:hypothetical protein
MANLQRFVASFLLAVCATTAVAQEPSTSEVPRTVEVTPQEAKAEVGQKLTFKAVAKNAAGEVIPGTPEQAVGIDFWKAEAASTRSSN